MLTYVCPERQVRLLFKSVGGDSCETWCYTRIEFLVLLQSVTKKSSDKKQELPLTGLKLCIL